jgi:hypothetical protein
LRYSHRVAHFGDSCLWASFKLQKHTKNQCSNESTLNHKILRRQNSIAISLRKQRLGMYWNWAFGFNEVRSDRGRGSGLNLCSISSSAIFSYLVEEIVVNQQKGFEIGYKRSIHNEKQIQKLNNYRCPKKFWRCSKIPHHELDQPFRYLHDFRYI